MTIHILCTARRGGRVRGRVYDHSHIVYRVEDGVGDIMTIHILCTARRGGRGTL